MELEKELFGNQKSPEKTDHSGRSSFKNAQKNETGYQNEISDDNNDNFSFDGELVNKYKSKYPSDLFTDPLLKSESRQDLLTENFIADESLDDSVPSYQYEDQFDYNDQVQTSKWNDKKPKASKKSNKYVGSNQINQNGQQTNLENQQNTNPTFPSPFIKSESPFASIQTTTFNSFAVNQDDLSFGEHLFKKHHLKLDQVEFWVYNEQDKNKGLAVLDAFLNQYKESFNISKVKIILTVFNGITSNNEDESTSSDDTFLPTDIIYLRFDQSLDFEKFDISDMQNFTAKASETRNNLMEQLRAKFKTAPEIVLNPELFSLPYQIKGISDLLHLCGEMEKGSIENINQIIFTHLHSKAESGQILINPTESINQILLLKNTILE